MLLHTTSNLSHQDLLFTNEVQKIALKGEKIDDYGCVGRAKSINQDLRENPKEFD